MAELLHFRTVDSQHRHHNGKTCTIVRTITEPDADHDAEVLPMFVVRFADGQQVEAWRDELYPTPSTDVDA